MDANSDAARKQIVIETLLWWKNNIPNLITQNKNLRNTICHQQMFFHKYLVYHYNIFVI